ncbi:MAG: carboxypeptidase regulatory-like domain-containing protein [Gammaproteobacteria bacterium]|nr:carboxypeptidase regulatory-like domain-containing protein [Gammaproteobacteria bacterium]
MFKKLSIIAGLTLAISASPAIMAAKYKTVDVANGGSISGKVSFTGKDPSPLVFKISKDNDVCGVGNREIDYVRVNGDALTEVVVYLDKVKQGKAFDDTNKDSKILQKGCEFMPYMQIMHNEGNAEIINDDPVLHNIHSYEIIGRAKKTVMNISQPDKGTINKKIKLKRGVGMKIECDAHDFMHGFVFVAKNPYYAKVAEDGTYTIDNIPAGKYKVRAFHGTLGTQKGKATLAGGDTQTVDFMFKKK